MYTKMYTFMQVCTILYVFYKCVQCCTHLFSLQYKTYFDAYKCKFYVDSII